LLLPKPSRIGPEQVERIDQVLDQLNIRDAIPMPAILSCSGGARCGNLINILWHGGLFLIESIAQAPMRVAARRHARSSD